MSHSHYDRDFVWGFSWDFPRIPSRNPYHREELEKKGGKDKRFRSEARF